MDRKPKLYFCWIQGVSFGFEFYSDEEGDPAWVASFGFIRLIRTKDVID